MSYVTNIILSTFIDESVLEQVNILNVHLDENGGGKLIQVDQYAGGKKVMENFIFLAVGNHMDIYSFVKEFKKINWETPEEVELFIKDQEDDIFKVYRMGLDKSGVE